MGRVKELSTMVDELRQCGERLIGIADEITAMFESAPESDSTAAADEDKKEVVTDTVNAAVRAAAEAVTEITQAPEEPSEVPWDEAGDPVKAMPEAPAEKPLTLEEVRAVLAEKSRAGHTAEIRELLKRHGADRLSAVDPSGYRALLAEAEVIGHA